LASIGGFQFCRLQNRTDQWFHSQVYPVSYWPGEGLSNQLEFALKYDGVNLHILSSLFSTCKVEDIKNYVFSKPTGKNRRRIWYLYELLTGNHLHIDDLKKGNYVELLDSNVYYTGVNTQIRRQRINDNLLGNVQFCAIIRKTKLLEGYIAQDFPKLCRDLIESYPKHLLQRALNSLYRKETKSSFEIERDNPGTGRIERFISLLHTAEQTDFFCKEKLIDLQGRIVDERFKNDTYLSIQNYVGETVSWTNERIHYFSPKPTDIESLMDGMIASHLYMEASGINAVIHAAIVAYGFVYIHPFDDGNGRIHRFLIHNILARRKFSPSGIMFPVSAVMLKMMDRYDTSLEAFSKPLMTLIEYSLDIQGGMTVNNETRDYYRYMDLTMQVQFLFEFILETINVELPSELKYLANYDETKREIQNIVDMPDKEIDLFIRFCLQNQGKLSNTKKKHFSKLTDDELNRMEKAVRDTYDCQSL
jgi:hypothetical protein